VKYAANGDLQFNMDADGIDFDLYFSGMIPGYNHPLHAESDAIKLSLCFPKQFVYKLRWLESTELLFRKSTDSATVIKTFNELVGYFKTANPGCEALSLRLYTKKEGDHCNVKGTS